MSVNPNTLLYETLKLAGDASAAAYKAGHDEGYRLGYREAVAACQRIVEEHFGKALPPVKQP